MQSYSLKEIFPGYPTFIFFDTHYFMDICPMASNINGNGFFNSIDGHMKCKQALAR